jgi:hypothetical protein
MQKKSERSAKAAGLKASCPSLRHTCASNLLAAGAEGLAIKELLGHASIGSSERSAQRSHQRVKQGYQHTIRTVMAQTRVESHDGGRGGLWQAEHARGPTDGPVPSGARGVPYRARALVPGAWVSRQSAQARRAIMPRWALSPVWTSSWSI